MSADNYMLIRKHPDGGFAVINAGASDDLQPRALKRHPRFDTLDAARFWADDQYSEYGTRLHPEVNAANQGEQQ